MTKLLVCGGRAYADREHLFEVLDQFRAAFGVTAIVHGKAPGADTLAGEWARKRGLECAAYPANWKKLGKPAGFIRNQRMLDEEHPDYVLAFPGGRGTADMMRRALVACVEVFEVEST